MRFLEIKKIKGNLGIIHFIGIGGIGMSGIVEIMHKLGYKVQGSELKMNSNTKRLSDFGIEIFEGHNPSNLDDVEYVVISSAIKKDNVEYVHAIEKGIPVIKRSEMLAEIMKLKTCVAISGSHGKTTTTSLIASMFEFSGLNPTVINGGIINSKSTNAYLGNGDYLIVEADESDATFINIPSTVAVITNIDPEHLDFYGSFENLIDAFYSFIHNLPFYGFAIACIDNKNVRDLVAKIKNRKIITYGIDSEDANVRAFDIELFAMSSKFSVRIMLPNSSKEITINDVCLPIPGSHNILNSLSAISIAMELDFEIENIKNGFKNFTGVKRRFTKTGEIFGIEVFDDYAHHPEEIISTLRVAKNYVQERMSRVIAIFQPHRYSRLESLFNEFANAFYMADEVYITDIYSAGEQEIIGYNHLTLVKKINSSTNKNAFYLDSFDTIVNEVLPKLNKNDLILFMGAGSITNWAYELPEYKNKITKHLKTATLT